MNRPDGLAPAKALFDTFPPSLADGIAAMASGAAVDGTATGTPSVLCYVRGDLYLPACADKATRVVVLVGTDCHPSTGAGNICQHGRCHLTFGITVSGAGVHVDHQTVMIVRQHMAQVAQLGRRNAALAVQLALGVGHGSMCGVTT